MKKLDLGQSVTVLANLGVIAGILLLVLEIRQNNDLMAEEAQRARAESIREAYVQLADNGELAAIWVKETDGGELTAVEEVRLGSWYIRGLVGYQTSYQQLPREELEPMTNWFRRRYQTSPTWRTTWEQNRDTFQPDFVQFMEERVTY